MSTLQVAIVSETLIQQHYLQHAIDECGYKAQYHFMVADIVAAQDKDQPARLLDIDHIDAWVIVVDVERLDGNEQESSFQEWLYSLEQPVIFSEGNSYNAADANFLSWTRQLKIKLLNLEGQIQLAQSPSKKARYVWVLAASTGGPDAVKRFLDVLEPELDVGFIYTQHIDNNQCQTLADKITRNSQYDGCVASHGEVLCANKVIVVPSEWTIELQRNGAIVAHPEKCWRGIYRPSIDQVVANVADIYGKCSGVIFFTGLGDDGIAASRLMSLQGGQVWSQVVSDCVATSMSEGAIATGLVSKIDTPENLALHLKRFIKQAQ